MTAYYVDQVNGIDAQSGFLGFPWKTVAKVNSSVQAAGDTVFFNRGNSWAEGLIPDSGGAGSPVNYDAYGGGANPLLDNIDCTAKSYLDIRNIDCTSPTTYAIHFNTSANHIDVRSGTFIYTGSGAIYAAIYGEGGSNILRFYNCTAKRPTLANGGDASSFFNCNHLLFDGGNYLDASHYSWGVQDTPYVILKNAYFSNPNAAHISALSASGGPGSNFVFISNNTLVGGGTNGFNATPVGITLNNANQVARFNLVRDRLQSAGKGITCNRFAGQAANSGNRIYGNVITGMLNTEYGGNMETDNTGVTITDVIWKNNILYNNGTTTQFWLWQAFLSNYHFVNNIFYKSGQTNVVKYDSGTYYSIAGVTAAFPASWTGNIQSNPLLDGSYRPTAVSPAIDAGAHLTTVTSATGSGTSFVVADSNYFCDGFGLAAGDSILVGSTSATITSINYPTNTITVSASISWTNGAFVDLPYTGSAPDIGVYEYGAPPTAVQFWVSEVGW